jgi:hypothetical protein
MLILDSKNYIPKKYFHGETNLDASFGFSKQLFLSLLVNFFFFLPCLECSPSRTED